MWISPAFAHVTSGSHGTSGGGMALLLLLGVGAAYLLFRRAKNRWRQRDSTQVVE